MTHLAPRVGWNYWAAVTLRLWEGCSWRRWEQGQHPSQSCLPQSLLCASPDSLSCPVPSSLPSGHWAPSSQDKADTKLPSLQLDHLGAHPKPNHPTPAHKNCPESISEIRKPATERLLPVLKEKFIQLCFLFGWSVTSTQHLTLLDNSVSGQKTFNCLITPFLVIPCAHWNFSSLLLQVLVQASDLGLGSHLRAASLRSPLLSPTPSQVTGQKSYLGSSEYFREDGSKGSLGIIIQETCKNVSSSRKYW